VRVVFGRLDRLHEAMQFINVRVDIGALLSQQIDACETLFDGDVALCGAAVTDVVKVNHLADVGETEPDPFRPQDPRETRPVAFGVNPRCPAPDRRDQPLVFIETQGTRGDPELL